MAMSLTRFEDGHDEDVENAERGDDEERAGDEISNDGLDAEDLEEVSLLSCQLSVR
jgi:hypothetical protein